MTEQEIFLAAIEISEPAAQSAFVQQVCAGNASLRQQVEALLAAHAGAGDFLATPAVNQLSGTSTPQESGNQPLLETGPHETVQLQGDSPLAGLERFLTAPTQPKSLGRLGHYEVFEVLGRGAFGTVLKAFDDKLHRMVAIKVISPELAATSPPRKRFLREARASAAIRHDNVVAVHAVEETPIPYLVMDYIPGLTLQQVLEGHGPLEVPDVLRIAQQIAAGLAAAHAQSLIHRDIKPANILMENGLAGRVKITDFGLARAADDASMTQSGTIAGTPLYMSPEQAPSGVIDQRSDLFSLGSVMYVMVSGRPPFRAPTTLGVLKRVVEDAPRPIREIIAGTPDWLCAIIARLHAKSPVERFESAQEVADLLGKCLEDLKANRPVALPEGMSGQWAVDGGQPEKAEPKPAVGDGGTGSRLVPAMPSPGFASSGPLAPAAGERVRERGELRTRSQRWPTIAAAALILLAGLGITEATGVTKLASTVIRLTTGSGTLVIETDDPGVKVTINGEEVRIQGAGVEQLTLKPGQYKVAAVKDGEPVSQELVTITRGGKQVVRVTMEGIAHIDQPVSRDPTGSALSSADPDRRAAEYVLSIGGTIKIRENGEEREIKAADELPAEAFELTSIALGNNPKTTNDGMAVFQGCMNLREIILSGTLVTDEGLAHFQDCRNLTHLNLDFTQVTDAGLAHFKNCKNLTKINLYYARGVTDAGVANFKDCKNLTDLNLNATYVTDTGLAHFKDCKNLEVLHLYFLHQVTNAGLSHFQHCKNLTVLDLRSTQVTDAGLAHFQGCKELRELNLSETNVTNSGLAIFQDCQNLSILILSGKQVTDVGLAHFKDCQNLTVLSLGGTQMTDAGLGYFKDCKNLLALSLDETQVTDAGLVHVNEWPKLWELYLTNTAVTDAGLVELVKFPGRHLSLVRTRVSLAGHEQLKTVRPDLQIGWSEPNRTIAESVLALEGTVEIGTPGNAESRPVATVADLPAEFFQVRRVSLAGVEKPLDELTYHLSCLRFSEFDKLEHLDLSGINGLTYKFLPPIHGLRELNLANAGLTDVSLIQLPKLPTLQRLVLDGNDLKGPGLASLKEQPALVDLSLQETKVTATKIDELKQALPKCRIAWDGGVIEPTMSADPDRRAAEWVLSIGGTIKIRENGEEREIKAAGELPIGKFNLTFVDVYKNSEVDDSGLSSFRGCTQLEHLEIAATNTTDVGLAYFRDCKRLQFLNISYTKATDVGVAVFKDCHDLRHLFLVGLPISDASLANFSKCHELLTLELGLTPVSDDGLKHFRDCKKLVTLDLEGSFNWTDAGLEVFQDCRNLQVLNFTRSALTDSGLKHFQNCMELAELQLPLTRVTDAGLAHLKTCKNLELLYLSNTQVTDAGLVHLQDCQRLTHILLDNTHVTDAGLVQMKNWPKLGMLGLSGTAVSDAGLVDLVKFPGRNNLNLANTRVSKSGYDQLITARPDLILAWGEGNRIVVQSVLAIGGQVEIAAPGEPESRPVASVDELPAEFFQVRRITLAGVEKIPNELIDQISWLKYPQFDQLERVDLSGIAGLTYDFLTTVHGLRELDLTKAGLTDVSLAQLPKLPTLKRLVLDGNDLKGHGLASLKEQPALIDLSLKQTKVTAAKIDELKQALPKCRIAWDGGVVEP